MTHRCQAQECRVLISVRKFFCRYHWELLLYEEQLQLFVAWYDSEYGNESSLLDNNLILEEKLRELISEILARE